MSYTIEYEQFLNESVSNLFENIFSNKKYADIKKVAFHEYLETAKMGDLQTCYLKKSSYPDTMRWISSRITGLAQGQFFNTLKMIDDNKTLIGYAANVTKKSFDLPIILEEYPIKKYLLKAQSAILLRPKDISEMQKQKALDYLRKRLNEKYDYAGLIKSAFSRIFESAKKLVNNEKKEATDITNKFIKKFKAPMFCSNIIAMAYKYAKYDIGISKDIFIIWPCDFLDSDKFEKICIYKKGK